MDDPTLHFGGVLAAFFAIMNPIANTTIFLGLTSNVSAAARRGIAFRAVLLTFVIVAAFGIAGTLLMKVFGITLPACRIAGGLLVALVGYHMLQGGHSSVHASSTQDTEGSRDALLGMAVSPLALPVLAGPGTLVTAMHFTADATPTQVGMVLAAFLAICVLTLVCFLGAERIVRVLGRSFVMVISRIMGLLVAVIGTQMVIEGVTGVIAASK